VNRKNNNEFKSVLKFGGKVKHRERCTSVGDEGAGGGGSSGSLFAKRREKAGKADPITFTQTSEKRKSSQKFWHENQKLN